MGELFCGQVTPPLLWSLLYSNYELDQILHHQIVVCSYAKNVVQKDAQYFEFYQLNFSHPFLYNLVSKKLLCVCVCVFVHVIESR